MKKTGGNIYDNEYYEKKYKKYKQKYLFSTRNQIGGMVDMTDIVIYDPYFRFNPSLNSIIDLNSKSIIELTCDKNNECTTSNVRKKSREIYTYSPFYALLDGNFNVNSCIPHQLRPVSILLSNLCHIIKLGKCTSDAVGLYKDNKKIQKKEGDYFVRYYEPMVPTIKIGEYLGDIKCEDTVYASFLNDIKQFVTTKLSSTDESIIKKYLDSTKTYTYGDSLLKLIMELRQVSNFSHTIFSRISHLKTLPIKYFVSTNYTKDNQNNDDFIYLTKMKNMLEDDIFSRFAEKIYPFFIDIGDTNSEPKDKQKDESTDAKTFNNKVKFLENLRKADFNSLFRVFDKNNFKKVLTILYDMADTPVPDLDYKKINEKSHKSGKNIFENTYSITKTILTYLSYKELDVIHSFLCDYNTPLKTEFDNVVKINGNMSLEVLATNVFIVQDGCFLCESVSSVTEETKKFNVVASKEVNDICFISLCGQDFSVLPTAYDNFVYLNNGKHVDKEEITNKESDFFIQVLEKYEKEYEKLFDRLIRICDDNSLDYLSLIPFGLGAFLSYYDDDTKKLFINKYLIALKKAIDENNERKTPLVIYMSVGHTLTDSFKTIFADYENGYKNNKIEIRFHSSDAKSLAISLAKKLKENNPIQKVGFVNASDFIALIFGKIGYYTLDGYSDRYAKEEDFACTSTGMLACDDVYNNLGYILSGVSQGDTNENQDRDALIQKYKKAMGELQSKHLGKPDDLVVDPKTLINNADTVAKGILDPAKKKAVRAAIMELGRKSLADNGKKIVVTNALEEIVNKVKENPDLHKPLTASEEKDIVSAIHTAEIENQPLTINGSDALELVVDAQITDPGKKKEVEQLLSEGANNGISVGETLAKLNAAELTDAQKEKLTEAIVAKEHERVATVNDAIIGTLTAKQ